MADIMIMKPAAGTQTVVQSAEDARIQLDFSTGDALLERSGNDLVFRFEDGSSIVLQDFYTAYTRDTMPDFLIEGAEITGEQFFAALNEPDLMPAAGPAAASTAAGGRYYEYTNAELLDGVDRLGGLDMSSNRAFDSVEREYAAALVEDEGVDYGVTVQGGQVEVDEAHLRGAGIASSSGSLSVNAPDGVASIVIGGVTVYENGAVVPGATVPTDEGYLAVDGFDPQTGQLTYTYQLVSSTSEHSQPGTDTIAHDLDVVLTDSDGSTASSTITIVIQDDVPTIDADAAAKAVASGSSVTGTVDIDYGADDGVDKSLTVNGQSGQPTADGKLSFVLGNNGTLVFDPATGGYTFTANANVTASQDLVFKVTDADGDTAETTVTVGITKPDTPTFTDNVTVDEKGLGDATDTSETVSWTPPAGYTVVGIQTNGSLGTAEVRNGTVEYTLSGSMEHAAVQGTNTAHGADSFTVTIQDAQGNTYEVAVNVDVVDDVPTLAGGDFSGAYGTGINGTVDFDFGADNGIGATIELSVNGGTKVTGVTSDGGKTYTFMVDGQPVTLNAETGVFHYDLPVAGSDAAYTFQFTVTDADGDVVSLPSPVEVTVEGTDLTDVKGSVIGDDDNVLTAQPVDVTMPELPAGVTLETGQTADVTLDGVKYGELRVDADGKVTFVQTVAYSGDQHNQQGEGASEVAKGFSGELNVTLADGSTSTITVDVSILDDAPTITVDTPATGAYGSAITGSVDMAFGADGEQSVAVALGGETVTGVKDGNGDYTFTFKDGSQLTLDASTGNFSYSGVPASGTGADYTFTFTVTDKDGDTATATTTATLTATDMTDVSGTVTSSDSDVAANTDGVAGNNVAHAVEVTNLPSGAQLVAGTYSGQYGTITVDATGKATYEQTGLYTHKEQGADTQSNADSVTVKVTLDDGSTVELPVKVSIVDDVPTINADDAAKDVGSGAEVTGTVNIDYGADAGVGKSLTVNGQNGQALADGTLSFGLEHGTLVFNPATGSYTFTANANVTDSQELLFKVTDADGDAAEATVTVDITKPDAPTFTGDVTVDEKGLTDQADTSETASWTPPAGYTIAGITTNGDHGTAVVKGDGTVEYTLSGAIKHNPGQGTNTADNADSFTVTIQDAQGNTYEVAVNVDVVDDVPTISATDGTTTITPGDSGNNLQDSEQSISFTEGSPKQPVKTSWWDGQVNISAAKVTYETDAQGQVVYDADGKPIISDIDGNAYKLGYSSYNTNNKENDHGLTVNGGAHSAEIGVSPNGAFSEGIVIDLGGKLAYGMTINFGAFYNGQPGASGQTSGDTVSEKALVTFYRDGQVVASVLVEGNDPKGSFTLNTSDVVAEGFDKAVISVVDNGENSDFVIQGFDFITKPDNPLIVTTGTVTGESGADGFADGYENAVFGHATNESYTVIVDGVEYTATLEVTTGSTGDSILTATLDGKGEKAGDVLFSATLDKDGNWTMEQYEEFRVQDEGGTSNEFELKFETRDSDGDTAETSVSIPLEVTEQTTTESGAPIGNSDDVINITGGDGVAGTIASGDTGGVIEGGQTASDYNVCFVLDTSGSMDTTVSGKNSRLDVATQSIENFIKNSIHEGDFVGTVNLAIVPFASRSGSTIKVTITKTEDGESYTIGNRTYDNYDAFQRAFHTRLAGLDADGGTNYEAGFSKAAEWFEGLGDTSNATGNITYFLSDGVPTYHGTNSQGGGKYATQSDVKGAWNGYQKLLASASDIDVNAIGFGNLSTNAMKTLAMLDNTATPVGGVAGNQPADGYLYYGSSQTSRWQPPADAATGGNATKVTDANGLDAAFESGFTPPALFGAGSDAITAEESISSAIIYGDVMNTDGLLFALTAAAQEAGIKLPGDLPEYGSGSQMFAWLEKAAAKGVLDGTDYAQWTHQDSVDYMLQHHAQLGYETRMDGEGTFYLIDMNGNVLNEDGTPAHVSLDDLTGRTGGNDTLTGSAQDDIIFGQEGNDTIHGGAGNDTLYGGTGDDRLFGDEGDDVIFGGAGDDYLDGGSGNDYLNGGEGADTIHGGEGNDIIRYDAHDILVDGGDGMDFLVGENVMDTLLGHGADKSGIEIRGVEFIVDTTDQSILALTDMDALADKLGITLNGDGTFEMGGAWTPQAETVTINNLEYVEYHSSDHEQDTAILVQKAALENHNG